MFGREQTRAVGGTSHANGHTYGQATGAQSGQATDPRGWPSRPARPPYPTGKAAGGQTGQSSSTSRVGLVGPQPGAVSPPPFGRLPSRPVHPLAFGGGPGPDWWWLSCHGGAGSSTLAVAIPGGADAFGSWPVMDPPLSCRVVLVARTHAGGLWAAQTAVRHWASGSLPGPVQLLGLVTVADAPGRLPRPLREMRELLVGGLPATWHLPWVEALRLGDPLPKITFPAAFDALAQDLQRLVTGSGTRA